MLLQQVTVIGEHTMVAGPREKDLESGDDDGSLSVKTQKEAPRRQEQGKAWAEQGSKPGGEIDGEVWR